MSANPTKRIDDARSDHEAVLQLVRNGKHVSQRRSVHVRGTHHTARRSL